MEAHAATVEVVDLNGDLDWKSFKIPDGSEPVALARLRPGPGGSGTMLVRFPATFRREGIGWYEAAEEFVVLQGTLHMNQMPFAAPHWVYAPALGARADTKMTGEVLALARFDGTPRWHTGTNTGEGVDEDDLSDGFDAVSPLGRARLLRAGDGEMSWWVQHPESRPAPVALELLDPVARLWAWVPAGETVPSMPGPCVVRTFEEDR